MTDAPIHIGTRRELFVDDYMIDLFDNAALHLHPPVRKNVVFAVEEPRENACSACYNLVQDQGRVRVYYRGYYPVGRNLPDGWNETQTTNLLVSENGIDFERPNLGLVEAEGSKDNNIVLRGYAAHNFCVFLDPNAPPTERYKAVGGSDKDNLHGFASPDGLDWSPVCAGPLQVSGAFDSVNVALWDLHAGCYRLLEGPEEGVRIRAIQSCTSDDFIHWSQPVPHHYAEGVPFEHFYTNATAPCPGAEHILLSFPMRFVPERCKNTEGMDYPGDGISDAVFMSSRDGVHWDRTFMEAWLRAGYGGGEVLTKPLVFAGDTLFLNYSTSAVGSIRVEVQDAVGKPIESFSLEDAEPLFGDELEAAWPADFSALKGTPVRFRFVLRDADLFSFRLA